MVQGVVLECSRCICPWVCGELCESSCREPTQGQLVCWAAQQMLTVCAALWGVTRTAGSPGLTRPAATGSWQG